MVMLRLKYKGHKPSKKIRTILLTLLIVLSTITTLPIFQNQTVSAAGPVTSDSKGWGNLDAIDWQLESTLYYKAITNCIRNGGTNLGTLGTSNSDANSGKWGYHDNPQSIGVFMKGSAIKDYSNTSKYFKPDSDWDGKVICNNTNLYTAAFSLWGLSGADILCNIGYIRDTITRDQSVSECEQYTQYGLFPKAGIGGAGLNTDQYADNFSSYIKKTIYGGKDPTITRPEWYVFYRHTLNESCIPGIDSNNGSIKKSDSSLNYNNVSYVNDLTGDLNTSASYGGNLSSSEKINLGPIQNGFLGDGATNSSTCSAIVKTMNGYAKDYSDLIKKLIKNGGANTVSTGDKSCSDDPTQSKCNTSCAVTGVGWLVCPVITFLGGVSDQAYSFLSKTFLETNPAYVKADSSNSVYNLWGVMRNIANVIFVIAFLVVIISQITGFGISNYGIKKMLPKLIVVAILVNLSFLICQVAIDVSNILGASINGIFSGLGQFAQAPSTITDASSNGFGWAAIITGILAGGVTLVLAISLPVLLAVLLSLMITVLIMVARTALIILLVIVAPIAFAMYLLPGTESLFKKWWKLSLTLLMLYPIVSLLFGSGNLAAKVINSAANGSVTLQLVAIGAAVLPLFALPSLLQNSLKAVGSIGAKMSSWGARANSNVGQKVKSDSKLGAGWSEAMNYRHQQRSLKYAQGRGEFAGGKIGQSRLGRLGYSALGGHNYQQYATTRGTSLADAEFENDVKAAESYQQGKSSNDRMMVATGVTKSSEAEQVAAVRYMMKNGSYDERKSILQYAGSGSDASLKNKKKALVAINDGYYASGDQKYFGSALGGDILAGNNFNVDNRLRQQIEDGKISPSAVVSDASATRDMSAVKNTLTDHGKDNLVSAVRSARTLPNTREKINGQFREHLNTIDPEGQNSEARQQPSTGQHIEVATEGQLNEILRNQHRQ